MVYFLILVGGIVRSTGSGMGCPDWPKCFGQWVPPTDVSQLPEGYRDYYSDYRHQKNVRIASYLNFLGMEKRAQRLLNDERIREEAEFNPLKTWVEYINRLIGAIVGLMILATAVIAWFHRAVDKLAFAAAAAALVLVLFQGWLGSVVVSTNLLGWTVTVHMIVALIIVLLLIYLNYRIQPGINTTLRQSNQPALKIFLGAGMILLGIQIVLGSRLREAVDAISFRGLDLARQDWLDHAGSIFPVHRSFSILVLAICSYITLYAMRHAKEDEQFRWLGISLWVIILLQISSGAVMAYFAIPPAFQPLHLLMGLTGFGLLYYLFLRVSDKRRLLQV